MRDLFPKTEQLYQNYIEDIINIQQSYQHDEEEMFAYMEHGQYDEWELSQTKIIDESFRNEYDSLIATNTYFYGCPFAIYKDNYNERLQKFNNVFEDNDEYGFLESELNSEGITNFNYFKLNPQTKYNIEQSLRKRLIFIKQKFNNLSFNLVLSEDKLTYALNDSKKTTEVEIDHEDSSIKERIVILNEIGIIDFLRSKEGVSVNANMISNLLSIVLKEKKVSIQPGINAIISNLEENNNYPLRNKELLKKVKSKLIQIGFLS